VQSSIDLRNWLPIWTNSAAASPEFSDPLADDDPIRFYRATVRAPDVLGSAADKASNPR
jgi:hypothetical protein